MPFKLPHYFQKIKASTFADDYELDDVTVQEIEKLFQEYYSKKAWDSEARADAGRHAKREIQALAKTFEKLPEQWHAAFYSHYLQQHIIEAYHGKVTLPVGENTGRALADVAGCMNKLGALEAEFQRLKDAVNKVKSMGRWDSYAFPQFSSGRPTDEATEKLISGLDALASRMPNPPPSKNDFIEGALNIIGKLVTSNRAPGARTRKTLRNKRSMSRK